MSRVDQLAHSAARSHAAVPLAAPISREQGTGSSPALTNQDVLYRSSAGNRDQFRQKARRLGLCFNCSQPGHLAKECALKGAASSGGRVNGSSRGRGSDAVYLTATIGSRTESCLVDTGCQISLLPDRLAPTGPRQAGPKLLRAANGTPIDTVESVKLD